MRHMCAQTVTREAARGRTATIFDASGYISGWHAL